jgi:hypothetical protein
LTAATVRSECNPGIVPYLVVDERLKPRARRNHVPVVVADPSPVGKPLCGVLKRVNSQFQVVAALVGDRELDDSGTLNLHPHSTSGTGYI